MNVLSLIVLVLCIAGAIGFKCTNDSDCNKRGKCENSTCTCEKEYADVDCSHKRKQQLTAFLLEFIVGICGLPGVGRIYMGYTAMGVGHIILTLFWWIPLLAMVIFILLAVAGFIGGAGGLGFAVGEEENNKLKVLFGALGIGSSCCGVSCSILAILAIIATVGAIFGTAAWWYADWIRILTMDLKDSDGFELYENLT